MSDGNYKFTTIDEYHAAQIPAAREHLNTLRSAIKEIVPNATEVLSYNMPAFKLNGIVAYYAAHSKHVGFYPTASPIEHFQEELKDYNTSKGTVQFPFDQPIPVELVKKMILFKVNSNLQKVKMPRKK